MLTADRVSVLLAGRRILRDVSLDISPGTLTAVVGPNGAGKSTLLRALAGDLRCDNGMIRMNARALSVWPSIERAKVRAVVPQFTSVAFSFSAVEVVLLGRYPHNGGVESASDRRIALANLNRTGVAHLAERPIDSLSGGERQRVLIARALTQIDGSGPHICNGRYLLLDEPTSALDPANQHVTFATLRESARDRIGVVATTHDLNLAAEYADAVLLMHDGKGLAYGSPDEVLTEDGLSTAFEVGVKVLAAPNRNGPLISTHARATHPAISGPKSP